MSTTNYSHPVDEFFDAVPVNRARLMSEARHRARIERRASVELFGAADAASLRYCATEGLTHAMAREDARRGIVANDLYMRSLDPLERERVYRETEIALLRGRYATYAEQVVIDRKVRAHAARLAEIEALQAKAEAA